MRRFFYTYMRTEIFLANCNQLNDMREFVRQAASDAGLDAKQIYAVQLATDEACSNIIEHAYEGRVNEQIEITCNVQDDGLIIILHDHGKTFNPDAVGEPNLTTNLSNRHLGGLGVYMIRRLMDEIHFESSPESGNILTMLKRKSKGDKE